MSSTDANVAGVALDEFPLAALHGRGLSRSSSTTSWRARRRPRCALRGALRAQRARPGAELSEEDAQTIQDLLEERGLEVRDDCGRAQVEQTSYVNDELADADDRRDVAVPPGGPAPPAADARAGGRARQADRARRPRRQGTARELEPPARDLERTQVPGTRSATARPDPGGDPRADSGGREVRLPQGLQVLDVRDVLDPRVDPARDREPCADDPDPGAHRPARAQDRARHAGADRAARTRADRRGDRRRPPRWTSRTCAPRARPRGS